MDTKELVMGLVKLRQQETMAATYVILSEDRNATTCTNHDPFRRFAKSS